MAKKKIGIGRLKTFHKLPPGARARAAELSDKNLVAGCAVLFSADDLRAGALKHLGVVLSEHGLEIPRSVLPSANRGRASQRNVEGYTIVHRDLPKEKHYNYVETPNWGDASTYGTHTVGLPFERFPRTEVGPRSSRIEMACFTKDPTRPLYAITFRVTDVIGKDVPNREERLLEAISLLQENIGHHGVEPAETPTEDYEASLRVSWEVLPPGTADEVIARVFRGTRATPEQERVIHGRYSFLMSLKPEKLVYGTSGFERYFGAMIREDLVVFENVEYGNAIYVMFKEWKATSKLSRVELLSGAYGDDFERVPHVGNWRERVKGIVQRAS